MLVELGDVLSDALILQVVNQQLVQTLVVFLDWLGFGIEFLEETHV